MEKDTSTLLGMMSWISTQNGGCCYPNMRDQKLHNHLVALLSQRFPLLQKNGHFENVVYSLIGEEVLNGKFVPGHPKGPTHSREAKPE